MDFGGYFGTRLSVENAARAGARTAVTESEAKYPSAGSLIVSAVERQANLGQIPSNVDCNWTGASLNPGSYPPFGWTGTGQGCIGIWYFELSTSTCTSGCAPALCAQWSVANGYWDTWSGGVETIDTSTLPTGCVTAGTNIVVVGVGFKYRPLTPMPTIATGALTTYGETELLEEQ
jgi:hypothetical protein